MPTVDRLLTSAMAGLVRLISGATARWADETPVAAPCVFFANHSSHLDAVALWAALPSALRGRTRPVAARDYWEASALRRYLALRILHALLIERGAAASVGPLRGSYTGLFAALEQGDALIIFPEGTRGDGEQIQDFRAGIFHLARRFPAIPFIPVYIDNLNRMLPKGEIIVIPLLCSLRFGRPMFLNPGETREAFLSRARQSLLDLRSA